VSEINEEICGNCSHAEVSPLAECECCFDVVPVKVGYYEENDCFESRSEMFDKESLINFDY